jgi:hypothetical protein
MIIWSTRPGSNRRPPRWQGDAGVDFIEVFRLNRSYRVVSINSGGSAGGGNRTRVQPISRSGGPYFDGRTGAEWLRRASWPKASSAPRPRERSARLTAFAAAFTRKAPRGSCIGRAGADTLDRLALLHGVSCGPALAQSLHTARFSARGQLGPTTQPGVSALLPVPVPD